MRISFKVLLFVTLFSLTLLTATTLEEAMRNLDMGYYLVAEYQYNELLEEGNVSKEVLEGLALSLLNQEKYHELISLSHTYSNSSQIFNRSLASAFFQTNNYQTSFYYYDKALQADNSSLIDISGRGWSAYYLQNYSLAYADFRLVTESEYRNTPYDGLNWMQQNWKSNYSELFIVAGDEKTNLNLNYTFNRFNYSFAVNYNHNDTKENDRDMLSLLGRYNLGKLSFAASVMYATGDYAKLYDAFGLAVKADYLTMYKKCQNTLSFTAGYAYFESLSSQQIRLDYVISSSKLRFSNGLSYLYLDYVTPKFDKQEVVYHGSLSYKLLPYLSLSYSVDVGESNFAYNDQLLIYDDYDVEDIQQSIGLTFSHKSLTTYLKYLNRDFESSNVGIGVGYVF